MASPESGVAVNKDMGFNALHYARTVEDATASKLEEDHAVVSLLLELCPKAIKMASREGYSPLGVHIIAVSYVRRRGATSWPSGGRKRTKRPRR